MSTTWFVTGASGGLGLEIARQALAEGDNVVATADDPRAVSDALGAHGVGAGDRALVLGLNVDDRSQARAVVDRALERFGRIDVLVNGASRGLVGAVEETSDAEARVLFDTNVFGLLNVTRAVLPAMRAARSGTVVNVSPVGGRVGRAGWGVDCATRFAVQGLTEALALELAPLGVRVTTVEHGPLRTDCLDGSAPCHAATVIGDYTATSGESRVRARAGGRARVGDPVRAAQVVLAAVRGASLPMRLPLGSAVVEDIGARLVATAGILGDRSEAALSVDLPDVGRAGVAARRQRAGRFSEPAPAAASRFAAQSARARSFSSDGEPVSAV
ncbi:short-chain dehydrogenase/reductase [Actinomadura craniellae]|uniref:Short-chain dehydrogenase/reductase n=1 Tax=Actinomadura craniellae TaxID=2231787 RepID=A0A365HAV2_9ACTN|nr:SDR family NAD(P)-dependent oxidoreductase [Actinomadura craniellae]RAY16211.1 short-chain dehydrogenase/reductase [Actinomadura craniellae]